jgi:hypothetical protein
MHKIKNFWGLGVAAGLSLIAASPVWAINLNLTTWETFGDVEIPNANQANLSTDGLIDDDFDLGANTGDFNFSGNPAGIVGLGSPSLEEFLGISASQLDLNGIAYEGSAIKTTLTVSDRSELSFDWDFLTNETANSLLPNRGPFNDYSFFLVGQNVHKLADGKDTHQSLSCLGFDACTGVQKNTYILNPGQYTLAFGVVDIDDFAITSALSVSSVKLTPLPPAPTTVPEPSLLLGIWVVGGLGARQLRRSQ